MQHKNTSDVSDLSSKDINSSSFDVLLHRTVQYIYTCLHTLPMIDEYVNDIRLLYTVYISQRSLYSLVI